MFPSVLWHWWLGDRKDIQPIKSHSTIPRGSLLEQVEEDLREPADPHSLGKKRPLNGSSSNNNSGSSGSSNSSTMCHLFIYHFCPFHPLSGFLLACCLLSILILPLLHLSLESWSKCWLLVGWQEDLRPTTWHAGRPWPHCVRWGPSSPPVKGHSPQFSAHMCCGQMAAWTKMSLGMEVGLGPGDFVLCVRWGPRFPSPKGNWLRYNFAADSF